MKWCCKVMQGWYQIRGDRGFSVKVNERSGQYRFVMQHCALEPGIRLPDDFNEPVSIISELVVLYCPWCGKNLEKFYKKNLSDLCKESLETTISIPLE